MFVMTQQGRKGSRYHERNMQTHDEMMELGHEAIKGVTTVGSVAITANLMGGMLGAFPKP
jgi:hypothetical protein